MARRDPSSIQRRTKPGRILVTGSRGTTVIILTVGLAAVPAAALAHGEKDHAGQAGPVVKEQKDWGIAGDARSVARTVQIRMTDAMRFTPDRMELRQGDTVRFVVHNTGKLMHEFVIGTKRELDAHAALMVKFPNM